MIEEAWWVLPGTILIYFLSVLFVFMAASHLIVGLLKVIKYYIDKQGTHESLESKRLCPCADTNGPEDWNGR